MGRRVTHVRWTQSGMLALSIVLGAVALGGCAREPRRAEMAGATYLSRPATPARQARPQSDRLDYSRAVYRGGRDPRTGKADIQE